MFGLSGNREHKKATVRISKEIHRQIRDAIKTDTTGASSRVASTFTVGYFYGFIRQGFMHQGLQGEQLAEKYFKPVCKKIPGNFYKVMQEQSEALDHAMKHENEEEVALYKMGLDAGIYDAGLLSTPKQNEANNLFNYLLNRSLDINSTVE